MLRIAFALSLTGSAVRIPKSRSPKGQTMEVAAEEAYQKLTVERLKKQLADGQVASEMPPIPDFDGVAQCKMSESACRFQDMTETTVVFTDDAYDTVRCYNGDPWAFVVIPGAADKLFYYLPGGGGCFDFPWLDFSVPGCTTDLIGGLISTGAGSGLADVTNPKSGIKGWSYVAPIYCSGGGHVSNTSFVADGQAYYQYGYNGNEIVRQWTMANFPGRLDSFVLAGSSAGSLGVGLWADTMLSSFSYNKATVVLDSYMAVFPGTSQGQMLKQLGACPLPPLAPWRADCEAGNGNMQIVLDDTIAKYPKVAFAHLQSKEDSIQLAFFTLLGVAFGGGFLIDVPTFYYVTNYMMNVYNQHPNYVTYITNSAHHVFIPYPVEWYSTSTLGPNTTAPAGTPMMYEWFNDLIEHKPVESQCAGTRAGNGAWIVNYCFRDLFPKTLSV